MRRVIQALCFLYSFFKSFPWKFLGSVVLLLGIIGGAIAVGETVSQKNISSGVALDPGWVIAIVAVVTLAANILTWAVGNKYIINGIREDIQEIKTYIKEDRAEKKAMREDLTTIKERHRIEDAREE